MHSLLSPARQHESEIRKARPENGSNHRSAPTPAHSGRTRVPQAKVIAEIQSTLKEFGVEADPAEIAEVLMEALIDRPQLCRGLFASQLVGAK